MILKVLIFSLYSRKTHPRAVSRGNIRLPRTHGTGILRYHSLFSPF